VEVEADSAKAYNTAVRALGRREHSVAELRRKLQQKHSGLGREALEQLLESLQQDRLLSDARFAEVLIRGRINRGYGPAYIQQELVSKGIDSELAERALAEAVEEGGVNWLQSARDLVARRHPQAAEDPAVWQKAARFLARRGFPSNLVMKALKEA
jgi:regulatory protein